MSSLGKKANDKEGLNTLGTDQSNMNPLIGCLLHQVSNSEVLKFITCSSELAACTACIYEQSSNLAEGVCAPSSPVTVWASPVSHQESQKPQQSRCSWSHLKTFLGELMRLYLPAQQVRLCRLRESVNSGKTTSQPRCKDDGRRGQRLQGQWLQSDLRAFLATVTCLCVVCAWTWRYCSQRVCQRPSRS